MRVVVGERMGGPEVLAVADREAPRPGPGEVVVEVAAAGVNYMDIYQREGVGNYRTEPPFVPGAEGAGTVVAVGSDVKDLSVGDHVAWAGQGSSYAEQVALSANRVVPVPDGMNLQVAAAAILQGMTAHYLCTSTYPVREGDITVVHAAAGGVGLLLTQLVKRRGGLVVGTTSGGEKVELALGDPVEHLARAPPQLGGVGDVMHQGGPGEEQRSAAVQPLRVDRRDLATRGSVQHHHAARAQRRQAVVEGVLTHAVVHDVRPGTVTGLVDDVAEAVIANDVIGAGLER